MMSDWRGMPSVRWISVVLLSGAVAAGGCVSRPVVRSGVPAAAGAMAGVSGIGADVVEVAPTVKSLREIASGILPGMELAATREEWRIGDRVLISVIAKKPTGVTTRLVLVELTEELDPKGTGYESSGGKGAARTYSFKSDVARTRITMFDETGMKIGESIGRFPVKLLGYGPYDGAEPMIGHADGLSDDDLLAKLPDAEFDRVMRGWGALFTFNGSLGKKGMFKQMMEDVIVKPSILRMIFHPTAALTFGANKWPTREESSDLGRTIPAIRVPLELMIADRPALKGELLAAEPVAPLSLCGGLIRAWGHRPDDEGVRVELELLGAARGSGGQEFVKATGKPAGE